MKFSNYGDSVTYNSEFSESSFVKRKSYDSKLISKQSFLKVLNPILDILYICGISDYLFETVSDIISVSVDRSIMATLNKNITLIISTFVCLTDFL